MDIQIYDKNFAPMPIADLLDGNHHFVIPLTSPNEALRSRSRNCANLMSSLVKVALRTDCG